MHGDPAGGGQKCTKLAGHGGRHKSGRGRDTEWGGKLGRYQPVESPALWTPALSREALASKFRDTPGQGAMDFTSDDPRGDRLEGLEGGST